MGFLLPGLGGGDSVCPAPVEHRRAGQLQQSGAGLPGGTAGPGRAVYPHGPPGEPAAFHECFPGAGGKFDWPDPEAPESGTEFCHGLRQQLAVLCDGTAVPCCLDGEGRMALGNLFDQPVEEILASPRAAAIREGFSRRSPAEELCRRCGYAARF